MGRRSFLCATAILWCAAAAEAGPLLAATWRQSLQDFEIVVTNAGATCTDTSGAHVIQALTCPTAGLAATGSSTASSYSVSLTLPLFHLIQFTTGGAISARTEAVVSGAAKISGDAGGAAATMGVPGRVTVKVAGHVPTGVNASMFVVGPTTLAKVPLSVGKGGALTGYFYVLTKIHYFQADSYAWTPNTVTITGLTTMDLSLPTVVAMGSFALTAKGGGTITLVAPSKIGIDGPLAQRRTASFTTLTLTYAPEPPLLLLGGVAASCAAVRRHARR